jgi:isoleucyl-tRNA synthetase
MDVPASVHLSDWPEAGKVNTALIREMGLLREAITVGLSFRAEAGIKVRQPLARATVWNVFDSENKQDEQLKSIAAEELNVKKIEAKRSGDQKPKEMSHPKVELDTTITEDLKLEGIARDIIRQIQSFRKESGLDVDDRILLNITSEDPEISKATKQHAKTIASETLATALTDKELDHKSEAKLAGKVLVIQLQKA